VPVLADWCLECTDFVLFYSSRRHVPVTLRTLVDFLRREARRQSRAQAADMAARGDAILVDTGCKANGGSSHETSRSPMASF
jgi:hypothetical protein